MNDFPDVLNFRLASDSRPDLEGIVCGLIIRAKRKNNYSILASSDVNGLVAFTKDLIQDNIKRAMEFFPMDYSSQLEDCNDTILFQVLGERDIESRIDNIEKWWSNLESASQLLQMLKNSKNKQVEPLSLEITVDESMSKKIVEVPVVLSKLGRSGDCQQASD